MKQPLIGIVPLVDEVRESYWMLPGYMQGVEQAGGVPVMLPLTDDAAALRQLADTCDGFLLTGGQDVSPTCTVPCRCRSAVRPALRAMRWRHGCLTLRWRRTSPCWASAAAFSF